MPEYSEHEPFRSVVFQAAPAVRTDAARPLSRLTASVVSVVFALTVFGVLLLGGSAFWTAFEPPGRTPAPLWIEPPEPGRQGIDMVEDKLPTPPRQQPVTGSIRDEDDSAYSGSGGSGDVARGSRSGSGGDSSGSSSGPGSGSGGDSSGSSSGHGSGSGDSSGSSSGHGSGGDGDSSGSSSGSGSGGGDSSGSGSGS